MRCAKSSIVEFGDEIFDFLTGSPKIPVIGDKSLALLSRRETRFGFAAFQCLPQFIAVISLIGDQNLRFGQRSE